MYHHYEKDKCVCVCVCVCMCIYIYINRRSTLTEIAHPGQVPK